MIDYEYLESCTVGRLYREEYQKFDNDSEKWCFRRLFDLSRDGYILVGVYDDGEITTITMRKGLSIA